ncbi:hypothetical protein HOD08_00985 [bacterium]|jgi:tetratricopeptide (TPR) repeat protein|nr:hypothetical protein [bacterium]
MDIFAELEMLFPRIYSFAMKYRRELVATLIATSILTLGVLGVLHYRYSRNVRAHRALHDVRKIYDSEIKSKDTRVDFSSVVFDTQEEKWKRVEEQAKEAYYQHKGSALAPMFLAMEAEASHKLGQAERAVELIELAEPKFSKKVRPYYAVATALIKLDSNDKAEQEIGLKKLKKIALDKSNVAHDLALFRLGEHYYFDGEYDEARSWFGQLIVDYRVAEISERRYESPWVRKAREKMKMISY